MRLREKELLEKIAILENNARFQNSELSVASSELRAAMSKIKILEGQIANRDKTEALTTQESKIRNLEEHSSKLALRSDYRIMNLDKIFK